MSRWMMLGLVVTFALLASGWVLAEVYAGTLAGTVGVVEVSAGSGLAGGIAAVRVTGGW